MKHLVIATTVVVALTLVSLASGTVSRNVVTLRLVEKQQTFHIQDNLPSSTSHRVSPGDTLQFSNELLNTLGKRAGTVYVSCVVVTGGSPEGEAAMVCSGTFGLAGGQIDVMATLRKGQPKIAIVGGTGSYEGAKGSVRSVSRKNTPLTDDTLHIVLP